MNAAMDKPAKPPNGLNKQFAVTSAASVQELKEPVELKKPEEPEEDPGWDEWPPDGNNRLLPSHKDRPRRHGTENPAEGDAATALLEEEARENCEPEPRRIVLTPENIAARGRSTRAIHAKQAAVEEPRKMPGEQTTVATVTAVGERVQKKAARSARIAIHHVGRRRG